MPNNLKKLIEAGAVSAFNEFFANYKQRIFGDGKTANGGSIGQYSKKTLYVSLQKEGGVFKTSAKSQLSNAGLRPRGKGKSGSYNYGGFKNGSKRKSSYFKEGYSEFRKAVKRQNGKVDLNLTGQLFFDVRALRVRGGFLEIAIVGKESINKARGNEEHFRKDIFSVSQKEIDALTEKIAKEALLIVERELKL